MHLLWLLHQNIPTMLSWVHPNYYLFMQVEGGCWRPGCRIGAVTRLTTCLTFPGEVALLCCLMHLFLWDLATTQFFSNSITYCLKDWFIRAWSAVWCLRAVRTGPYHWGQAPSHCLVWRVLSLASRPTFIYIWLRFANVISAHSYFLLSDFLI